MSIVQKILAIKNGDKILHFVGGGIIGLVVWGMGFSLYVAAAASVVGALKELYDYKHKDVHTPDVWDWLATTAGGIVVQVIAVYMA